MIKSIEIMLIPSLLSTIKNMGIDQDEYDEDEINRNNANSQPAKYHKKYGD